MEASQPGKSRRTQPPPGGPLKRLLQKLRVTSVPTLLTRLRPLLPFICVFIFMAMRGMRRSTVSAAPLELSYAAFMQLVETRGSTIADMRISPSRISFLLDGQAAFTRPVRASADLIWFLHKAHIDFRAAAVSAASVLLPLVFPCVWLALVYAMMRKQMGGATGSVGKKGASLRLSAEDLSFDDVAGIDVAKEEVREIVTMLTEPGKYAAAGARLPSGVLMAGPPGTGKTLLARVVAAQAEVSCARSAAGGTHRARAPPAPVPGESEALTAASALPRVCHAPIFLVSQVPFFYCSGSDFVELFVGRGAARMRALFKEASAAAPCLIFIDELDALGKQRSLRISGSNDEAEQTLNQMLACMDGAQSQTPPLPSRVLPPPRLALPTDFLLSPPHLVVLPFPRHDHEQVWTHRTMAS
jgi:cell division protease FtsH